MSSASLLKYVSNDTLVLKAALNIYGDQYQHGPCEVAPPVDLSLMSHMRKLLSDTSMAHDVRFTFPDTTDSISCHRCILMARSPVFEAMFKSDMAETISGEIRLSDVDINVMKELLIRLYTDSYSDHSVMQNMAAELLAAGTKYGVAEVVTECQMHLVERLNCDNVLDLLFLADACSAQHLKDRCVAFAAAECPSLFQGMIFSRRCAQVNNNCGGFQLTASMIDK
jgi:speckle-type POZ protein